MSFFDRFRATPPPPKAPTWEDRLLQVVVEEADKWTTRVTREGASLLVDSRHSVRGIAIHLQCVQTISNTVAVGNANKVQLREDVASEIASHLLQVVQAELTLELEAKLA